MAIIKRHKNTTILKFLVFQTRNFGRKNQIWTWAKKSPCHFGQVDFNMSNVTRVVFFISKVKTI